MEIEAETRHDTTLDKAEVSHFERLANEWWDENGPFRALHSFNPVRLAFILEEVGESLQKSTGFRSLEGLSILDIGCGGGLLSEPLARLGGRVTGIDPVKTSIAVAQSHAASQKLNIDYRAITAEQLAAEGVHFNYVIASEVIEHVADVPAFLATCRRLLTPRGVLILSTLNRTPKSYALAIVAAEYFLRLIPRGTHDWNKFITPGELQSYLESCGLEVLRKNGLVYNPLSGTFRTSPTDLSVNYLMSARLP